MFDHGGQRRLFDAADRVTHRFALEIRRRRDVLSSAITVFNGVLISEPTRISGRP